MALLVGGLCIARGQTSKVSYWYDQDVANRQETTVLNGSFTIGGAYRLGEGLHKVSTVLLNEEGAATSVMTTLFYVPDNTPEPYTSLYYWFDNDVEHKQEAQTSGIVTVDAESLSGGLHTIHFAANDTQPSSVASYLFYVNPQPVIEDYTLRFWTDDEVETTRDYVILDNGLKEITIDDHAFGDHDLRAMLIDSEGRPMSVESRLFTYPEIITGDINSDGKVDVSDYVGIANHILGIAQESFNEQAADVNEDGVIDVLDYVGVANIILTGSIYGSNNAMTKVSAKKSINNQ